MKNIIIITFAALSIILSSGCKKKKTTETVDPCANTVCLNGGTCNDGSCACPLGFSGADCGTQRTPTVIVTSIKVTNFPGLDGTSTWDAITATNPDLLAVFKKVSTGATILTTGVSTDATVGTPYILNGVTPTVISDFSSQYTLELWDKDTGITAPDDLMGSVTFNIYTSTNKFPSTLTVTSGSVTFEVSLTYTF